MTAKQRNRIYKQAVDEIVESIKPYDPDKIILFGSAIKGKFHADSDIDLLVIKDTTEPFWERQLKVTKMYRGWVPTDIFVITPQEYQRALTENRFFLTEEILKKGKIIYEKGN